jgi:predicted nuclease of predicted toxin-antitoxin system
MTLRLVIDVNLSPDWAAAEGYAVFSHDLDFSTMRALTHAGKPSLIQLRGPKVLPEQISELLIASIRRFQVDLEAGALLLIEPGRSRVRVLPL